MIAEQRTEIKKLNDDVKKERRLREEAEDKLASSKPSANKKKIIYILFFHFANYT